MKPIRATLVLAAALALCALAAAPAASAEAPSPWWQLLSGSRPTNLQPAPDQSEIQKVSTAKGNVEGEEILVAPIKAGGETIGCLGVGEFFGQSADQHCKTATGGLFEATETKAEFLAVLEAAYGGVVEVSGPEAVGEGTFTVTTPGRWVPALEAESYSLGPFPLGSASSEVTSEGSGRLVITLTNLGNAATDGSAVHIHDALPSGAQAYDVTAFVGANVETEPLHCELPSTEELECSFEGELPPYEAIEVEVLVALKAGAGAKAGTVTVSGGAAPPVHRTQPLNISAEPVPFGLEYFSMRAEAQGGDNVGADGAEEARAAGSHPFQLTTTIVANSGPQSGSGRVPGSTGASIAQPALPRNLRFTLPTGFIANVTAVKTCEMATFLHQTPQLTNECPADSAIGASSVTFIERGVVGFARIAVPVFNLVPGRGEPARFGLMVGGDPVLIDTSIDPDDSYRASAEVRNITQVVQFLASTTTLWGNPGAAAHDGSRGWKCVYHRSGVEELPGECKDPTPSERDATPFLRLPVSCASSLPYDAAFEPWNVPVGSLIVSGHSESPSPAACNQVPFDPTVSNAVTSKLASNPSGLDIGIEMPNDGLTNPKEDAISEAQFKRTEVILPKGVTINPSQAEGLATCSEADYNRERYDSAPGVGCPQASKIGSVQISTPLLKEELSGAVYVSTPYENPGGGLIGLYLVAKIPDRGILVKQSIEVRPDPQTGQLVSIADDVPQLPLSSFKFHFREGGRSPLITPPGCGTFHTVARFTPWSAADPDNPAPSEVVERTEANFTIDHGVDGGPCPSGPAPFHPGFEAGTLNNQAGSYSPFVMHLTRQDGEQDMGKFSFVLPPGVVGKLAGIPYCPEAGIARAQSRQGPHGGAEERSDPSCPAASQIGTTVGGAGVGNQLTYVKGKLYLAGPWHGDPLSVVAVTPAVAGPFDAGTVVVREALRLNPITARAEVDGAASDPIPHILKGIPLNLRDLRVYADKPDFTLNATSCEPFAAQSTIWGDGTALEPLGQTPVELSSRYQAAGCASLGFKPKLAIKLKGGTKRGAHPALKAVVTPRPGDANFSRAVVRLPHSAFLDQAHIRTICTRVQFAAGAGNGTQCPAGSVYGHAKAWTPLLDQPLEGPVFLRSSSHNLPDMVLALHGIVDIDLASRIDSVHGGIRSTFESIPDAPVSRFILEMRGGKKGLIVNSTNLCKGKNRANAKIVGQNGRRSETKPVVRAQCGKRHSKSHKRHHERGSHR